MEQFRQMSSEWWKPDGEFAALRTLNKLRVPFIKNLLFKGQVDSLKPLCGYKFLDVGSGGGILAEVKI